MFRQIMTVWMIGVLVVTGTGVPTQAQENSPREPGDRPTIWVSTRGNDSNSGRSADAPLASIARAFQIVRPGDVILVAGGTYRESLKLDWKCRGTPEHPIILMGEPPAPGQETGSKPAKSTTVAEGASPGPTILDADGADVAITGQEGGAVHLTIRNLTIQGCHNGLQAANAAVRATEGWRLENVRVRDNDGVGISVQGRDIQLVRCTAEENGQAGVTGSGRGITIRDTVLRRNNRGRKDPVWKTSPEARQQGGLYYVNTNWEAGGFKGCFGDDLTIDGVHAYENFGTGIWLDIYYTNVKIRNCNVYKNTGYTPKDNFNGHGIQIELITGPSTIEGNRVSENSAGGITLTNSTNIVIENNTLRNNPLLLVDATGRTVEIPEPVRKIYEIPETPRVARLSDVRITRNTFQTGSQVTGYNDLDPDRLRQAKIAITGNLWKLGPSSATAANFRGMKLPLAILRRSGIN